MELQDRIPHQKEEEDHSKYSHSEDFPQGPKSQGEENKPSGKKLNCSRRKSSAGSTVRIGGSITPGSDQQSKNIYKMTERMMETNVDHQYEHNLPRDLFVQMNELEGEEWVEQARWIKYEEDLEKETERWGRPHIATLSFHSLINLKTCLESGIVLLDLEARDLPSIAFSVVDRLCQEGLLHEEQQASVLRLLLLRHKCVPERSFGLSGLINSMHHHSELTEEPEEDLLKRRASISHNRRASLLRRDSIVHCLKDGTEGTISMVGSMQGLRNPIAAFVRMTSEGVIMPNVLEVPLPVRFMFILLTPIPSPNVDCHEVFQSACYQAEQSRDLLSAINDVLDESVVLPPGDYESKNLLSFSEIQELRKRRQTKQRESERGKKSKELIVERRKKKIVTSAAEEKKVKTREDPLVRTDVPFGGLINDIKQRFPFYWSDITDGLNLQCLSTTIFIYFACLSPAIAFGGLYGDKTENLIGVPVTLMVTSVSSVTFALLSGNPLIILGCTGPNLLFDEALFEFASGSKIEFLPWRVWTSYWIVIIALLVAGFQGSTLVKHFTRFTTDIFASLIALIFLFEAMKKLYLVFKHNPITPLDIFCNATDEESNTTTQFEDVQVEADTSESQRPKVKMPGFKPMIQPNAALLAFILMFGTFSIAYILKIFKNGKYLGRTARLAIGDFCIPIAILTMSTIDYLMEDKVTQKLQVPSGFQVTASDQRSWVISPMGLKQRMQIWAIFAAVFPALLLYLILYLNTLFCELIMLAKTTKKGGGLHWDIVLLSLINVFAASIGGPWMCAATVRAVSHVAALSVMSTTQAPGESAKIVHVIDQRVTGFLVGVLIGASVLLAPALQLIPYPVLFGVFLYMGVSAILGGIQFFDRLFLLFKPVKHHPQVRTWKMHMFTAFQFFGLASLWTITSIKEIALLFPFCLVALSPLRKSLDFLYTKQELEALDGPNAGQTIKDDDDDLDVWEEAYGNYEN